MRALDKLRDISKILREKKFDFPEKEAEEIICHILKIDRIKLYTLNPSLNRKSLEMIDKFVKRRLTREPLQYLIGECSFFNLKIKVGEGVLIPRPETEVLVEEFLKIARENKENALLLDLCTGSGCIALAIAKNLPTLKVIGIDISKKALEFAQENKRINNIKNAYFLVGDLFSPLRKKSFFWITANPPYVKTHEIATLQPEIRDYEPKIALNGGEKGIFYYEKILQDAPDYLINKGYIFLEIGKNQAPIIKDFAYKKSFEVLKIVKDLAGIERVVILKRS